MVPLYSFFDPASRWYYLLRWMVLILLGLAIYGQTFGFNFVFDDLNFIVRDPFIRRFDHVYYIWKIYPQTRTLGFYSFALNFFIGQLHPQGYHIFNFVIHLAGVGLVWATAGVVFQIAGWLPSNDRLRREAPFIIAILFLVHPCQTQAVSYISQRFESMATVFYLGSIYSYLRGRISPSKGHKVLLYICSTGFALLGIFTKEVAATIPLMILAAELIFFKGNRRKILVILMVGGTIFFLLFLKLVRTDLNIFFHLQPFLSQSHDGDMITVKNYLLTQMRVFLTFMRLLILPVHQNLDYDYPLSSGLFSPPLTFLGALLISAAFFLIFKLRNRSPIISFGLAWILITFSINLAPRANVIFEHKLYLISFGFFLILVNALFIIVRQRPLLLKLLVILVTALSILSFLRNQVWKNEITLWEDVANKSPYKARSYNGLGAAWDEKGGLTQALSNYNKAIAIDPGYANAYNGLGNIYNRQHDFDQALSNYNKAIAINPENIDIYINRGICYAQHGDLIHALSDYDRAIAINPSYAKAYSNRGRIYLIQKKFTQAILDYNKAIDLDPAVAAVYLDRGVAYYNQGNFSQAMMDFNKAVTLKPDDHFTRIISELTQAKDMGQSTHKVRPYINLGSAYYQQGDFIQALSNYNKAIEINPGCADAYYGRGNVYSQLGDLPQALSNYNKAIEIDPGYTDAYYNRGNAYAKQGDFAQALSNYDRAIEIKPRSPQIYNSIGNAYTKQGNFDQALSNYNKAIEIDPGYADAYYNRGIFWGQHGHLKQAVTDFTKAIAINPKDGDYYYNRGFAYHQLKNYNMAEKDVNKAKELEEH